LSRGRFRICREPTLCSRFGVFGTAGCLKRISIVFERSYFARQVQVCMSLARETDDPAVKRRYEALAVEFAQNIGGERDLDMTAAPLASIDPEPERSV
jgi:hypothetical protein